MQSYYAFIALDLARQRAAEADAWRLAAIADRRRARPGAVRRVIARAALAVARFADEDLGRVALSTPRAH